MQNLMKYLSFEKLRLIKKMKWIKKIIHFIDTQNTLVFVVHFDVLTLSGQVLEHMQLQ